MTWLVLTLVLAVLFIVVLAFFASRYKRCPSNQILVIYGRTGRGAAKCVQGGASFVWPVLQDYEWLDLEPFVVPIELDSALSQENIRVSVPTTVTAAISTEGGIMQNAAVRLLGLSREDVRSQAQDIILGQMRAVIATMRIEEINRDRQAFMEKVNEAVSFELEKIGLSVINVNIKDIEDESGYIEALGRKAAAEAVNQALVDVAEQEKLGKIGVAQREREQRTAVAAANSEASIGESEADRNRRKAVAAAEAAASIGESEADRDRRQQSSVLNAEAVSTEAESSSKIASYNADLRVAEENARAKGEMAHMKADGSIRVSQEEAQRAAEEARAERERARLAAEVVVPAQAQKERAVVEAQAEKEKRVLLAQGEAEGVLAQARAEAQGVQATLDAKAQGYRGLIEACAGDASRAAALLLIEKFEEIARIQTDAVKSLPLDKMMIWDGGGSGGVSDLGRRMMGVLPPMHELARMAGLELPDYLGKLEKEESQAQEGETRSGTKKGAE